MVGRPEVGGGEGDRPPRTEVVVRGVEVGGVAGCEELGGGEGAGGPHGQPDDGLRQGGRRVVRRGRLGRDPVAGGQDDVARPERDEPATALPDAGLGVLVGADARLVAPQGGDGLRARVDADDDAPVGGDVAVGGERRVDRAVEEQQSGALLGVRGVEGDAGRVRRGPGDRDGVAGHLGAGGGVDGLEVPRGRWRCRREPSRGGS